MAVADTLATMINREKLTTSSHEGGYLNPSDPTMVTAEDRKKLVNWCYLFIDHCRLSRETVASAMEMVDRFLSSANMSISNSADAGAVRVVCEEALIDRSIFQLLTVTALYVAIKINERDVFSSDLFAEMSSGSYSAKEIEDMELILLNGLSWRCHAPTAYQAGLSILSLMLPNVDIPEDTWGYLMDDMKYSIELAVLDYYFCTQRTSTIALAAIYNAIGDIRSNRDQELLRAFLNRIIECFDFDHPKQISAGRRKLQSLLLRDDDVDESDVDEECLGLDDLTNKPLEVSSRSSQGVMTFNEQDGNVPQA